MEELEAVDHQILVPAQRDAGPPAIPARGTLAAIELGAEHAEDDDGLFGHVGDLPEVGGGMKRVCSPP
jgi:hypothetical protein